MLEEHLGYVADHIRLEQFKAAVGQALQPGDHVADLGCGSGILGLLCLQTGAAQVYAIDSTAMIEVARETLTRAGLGKRGVFMRGYSHQIELPQPVDVVICDHVGYFGFDYGIVNTLDDARRRLLKPGGRLIPARIRLQIGAIESEPSHAKAAGWQAAGVPGEFHWLRQHGVNAKYAVELTRDEVLSAPAELGDIDLYADNPGFFSWTTTMTMTRNGVMHGLAGWFECELAEGVWMTNSPLSDRAIKRSQAFLPIDETVQVSAGDEIKATIMARPTDQLIAWSLEFPASGQRFNHSTWQGLLLAPEDLIRANPSRVPQLSRQGQARITVLGYCDGRRTVREIEQAVLQDHPVLFPSLDEIARFVAQVLGRDTE